MAEYTELGLTMIAVPRLAVAKIHYSMGIVFFNFSGFYVKDGFNK